MIQFYFKSEILLFSLVIATIIAIPMKSLLVIERQLPFNSPKNRFSDDHFSKGKSYGKYIGNARNKWVCHLVESDYNHPFCGHQFIINDDLIQGVDLSSYDSISLDLDYAGEAPTIRLFLRNFDEAYSTIEDHVSTKYNMVEFEKELLDDEFEINLNQFKVADWWLAKRSIPFALSEPDMRNIVILEVQTGSESPLGKQFFELKGITVKRQLITNENFYLSLIIFWIFTILAWLGYRLYKQNTEILRQRDLAKSLKIENESLDRLTEQLTEKSIKDKLTGLLNREGIDQLILSAQQEFYLNGSKFSFILFDIDHFKKINDEYGHDVGDTILKECAQLVEKNIRAEDNIARWGGEEFLILSNNTDLKTAVLIAKKLRQLIASHAFSNNLNLTLSFGVATIELGLTVEELFKCVDTALYKAKRDGRNCVNVYYHW